MSLKRLSLAITLTFASSVPGITACSSVEMLTDGTYVVNDCWHKNCISWATKDAGLAARWVGNAYMDGAMC